MLDSDGSLHYHTTRKNILLCTLAGTEALLNGVSTYLQESLGFSGKIYKHGNIFILRICKQDYLKQFLHHIYDDATIYLNRKYQKAQEILNA